MESWAAEIHFKGYINNVASALQWKPGADPSGSSRMPIFPPLTHTLIMFGLAKLAG